jgi:hypothetical protein
VQELTNNHNQRHMYKTKRGGAELTRNVTRDPLTRGSL